MDWKFSLWLWILVVFGQRHHNVTIIMNLLMKGDTFKKWIFIVNRLKKKIDKATNHGRLIRVFSGDSEFCFFKEGGNNKKMAVSFPRLPRWLCGGNTKEREKKESLPKGSSSLNHSLKNTKTASSSSSVKKTKRGWIGRGGEDEKMGNVVFPEPDDPEWSIGWVEPHGPGFKTEDDDCGGFVVLVPCYKKVMDGSGNQIPNLFFSPAAPADGKSMEQWLSSMGKL